MDGYPGQSPNAARPGAAHPLLDAERTRPHTWPDYRLPVPPSGNARRKPRRWKRGLARPVVAAALIAALLAGSGGRAVAAPGEPTFTQLNTNPFGVPDVGDQSAPTFADLDDDGDLDVLLGAKEGTLRYFENTGSATTPSYVERTGAANPFDGRDVGDQSVSTFGDLDGDGDLDAFVGEYDGSLQYFENTGSAIAPSFASAQANPFGLSDVGSESAPTFVNLDGDGDLDLLVGNGDGDLVYFANTGTAGSPAFAAPQSNPFSLSNVGSDSTPSFGDLDGDNDLDLLVGNSNGDLVYFANTGTAGSPAFAASQTNPIGLRNVGGMSAPTFGDVDGDGDLDLLVGEENGNSFSFENTGTTSSPSFTLDSPKPFGLFDGDDNGAPTFGDLDGDSDLDLLVGDRNGNLVYFENVGNDTSPSFAPAQTNPFNLSSVGGRSAPTFGDLDGDGDLDLLVGNYAGNLFYFQNTGSVTSPSFAAASAPSGLSDVGYNSTPTFGDLDGDGDLDLLVGERLGSLFYFQNVGTSASPSFAAASLPSGLSDVGDFNTPTFGDGDGDGDLDLLVGNYDGNLFYFQNTGTSASPSFAAASTPSGLNDVGRYSTPAFGDLDGDGDPDVLVGEDFGSLTYFQNKGVPTLPSFAPAQTNPFSLSNVGNFSTPTFGDLDGDGDLDLLVGEGDGSLTYFQNVGSPSSPSFAAASAPTGLSDVGDFSTPDFGDLDGDGDLDLLVGRLDGSFVYFQNTGTSATPSFAAASLPSGLSDVGDFSAPTFGDLDGDGDLDLLVGEQLGNLFYFQNTGTSASPSFAAASAPSGLSDVGFSSTPALGDVEGDGDLDLLVGEQDGTLVYFQNTGSVTSPSFTLTNNPPGLSDVGRYSAPTFGNLDGDGDLDVLVGESSGDLFYFQNSSPLAVTLAGFTATADDTGIMLDWETVSETNNQGFYLYRDTSPDGPGTRLTETLIASESPGSNEGAVYQWRDEAVGAGTTYYWLEAVALDGSTTRHGPVSATVEVPTVVTVGSLMSAPAAPGWTLLAALGALLAACAGALGWKRR